MEMGYFYDNDTKNFSHVDLVNPEQLPDNCTLIAPEGFEPFVFSIDENKWYGVSEEDFLKAHPDIERFNNDAPAQEEINQKLYDLLSKLV